MTEPAEIAPRSPADITVLLVEDEVPVGDVLSRMLENEGYQVLLARRPQEAIDLASSHAGVIDLLVTDMVLPGMNGKDVADQIRAKRPSIRILFISGYPGEAMLMEPLRKHGAGFLHKPFPKRLFLDTVRALATASPAA